MTTSGSERNVAARGWSPGAPGDRVRRSAALIMGLSLAAGGAASGKQQQESRPPPSFRAGVHLSAVAVTVMGVDGLPVIDLGADDFELWLDGDRQDISFVLAPSDAPLEVAVLIDTSESVRGVRDLRAKLKEFLGALETDDCVLVLPFADFIGPGYWNVDVPSFIDGLEFGGNTKLNDAILSALSALSPHTGDNVGADTSGSTHCGDPAGRPRQRRRAVVLITDGRDQGSQATDAQVLLRAWSAHLPFVVLGIGGAATPIHPRDAGYVAQLEALVRAAGGRFIQAGRDAAPDRIFDEALHTLRSTYVLASVLAEPPMNKVAEWHPIEVRVRREGVMLAAPEGVYLSAIRRADAGALAIDARQALNEGRALAALDILAHAIDADAELWQPQFLRALATFGAGRVQEALPSARSAVYLQPLSPDAHAFLAEALLRAGRPEQAAMSVVNAAYLGADVDPAVAALQRDHGVTLDIAALAEVPRLWIVAADHVELPLQQQATRIARLLMLEVANNPGLALVAPPVPYGRTSGIRVELAAAGPNGELDGSLTLGGFAIEHRRQHRFPAPLARFEISAAESAALVGAVAPAIPASLAAALHEMLQHLR